MQDSIDDTRLLLGMAGWPHPQWRLDYFPQDLPEEWEFAYFSNDADCLMLSHQQWPALDKASLEDWLDDVPPHFRFFLSLPAAFDPARLRFFGSHLGALLSEPGGAQVAGYNVLFRQSRDLWRDPGGDIRLVRWTSLPAGLRAQRDALQALPPGVRALIVDDPAADPRCLADLRKVAELLGIA